MKFCELESLDYAYHHMAVSLSYDASLSSLDYQSGDKFVVKVRLASIKGIRMIFEHIIEKLPNHEVCHSYMFRTDRIRNSAFQALLQKKLLCSHNLGGIVSPVTTYKSHIIYTNHSIQIKMHILKFPLPVSLCSKFWRQRQQLFV